MISVLLLLSSISLPLSEVSLFKDTTTDLLLILPSPEPGYIESSKLIQEAQDYNSFWIME